MSSMGFEAYYSNYLSAQRGKLFDSLEAGPYDSFATNVALLPKEAALNARNKCDGQWGRTLLHFAVRSGRLDTVQLLLELGYDPNSFDSSISLVTPLMEAVKISHVEISELLIEHGADLTICDINHENILHYCARFGSNRLIKSLAQTSKSEGTMQSLASSTNIKLKFPEDLVRNTLMKETLSTLRESGVCAQSRPLDGRKKDARKHKKKSPN